MTGHLSVCLVGVLSSLTLLSACGGDARAWVAASAEDSEAADRALDDGDFVEARSRLEALLAREVPDDVNRSDARLVRRDAHERLARTALALGDLAGAEHHVAEGLGLGEVTDIFTVNLLTTRGRVREAQGRDREAAADYHRALGLGEALLVEALGDVR